MSLKVGEASDMLRHFLFESVYEGRSKKEDYARKIVNRLYEYFINNGNEMPPEYQSSSDGLERRVLDYIAGMTDLYAQRLDANIRRHDKVIT
jgi:dGTPase